MIRQEKSAKLIEQIRQSVIGEGRLFPTPFGLKPLIYADYTASGRSLDFIEDYIRDSVMPFYANTHSEASATGRQTTAFREQARGLIRQSVGAGEDDAVIFCGSGATSAIQKMVEILNIRIPANLEDKYHLSDHIPENDRPVIFIGPYEHHSNELAWRESIAEVVTIPLDKDGTIDQMVLRAELETYADRRTKIGSFSAASNVTGLLSDIAAITRILHEKDALAFWDYAAAGPYVDIDVRGNNLDGIYLSPHKFIGGPGTPGLLVIKRRLLLNRVPSIPGGGTVSYVSPEDHRYNPPGEHREEGGTPAIIESIRAGLVFRLKDAVGADVIEQRERSMIERAISRWSRNPAIKILGNPSARRLSILSFLIMRQGKPLHFGFVDALINDLFGIQLRGGCSCAGPYGHELLNIDMAHSRAIAGAVEDGHLVLKPGWVRLNFNYFIDEETFDYILGAVELIAEYGWKLLGQYSYDPERAIWSCRTGQLPVSRKLQDISFDGGKFQPPENISHGPRRPLRDYLDQIGKFLREAEADLTDPIPPLPEKYAPLRWFTLPGDAPSVA